MSRLLCSGSAQLKNIFLILRESNTERHFRRKILFKIPGLA